MENGSPLTNEKNLPSTAPSGRSLAKAEKRSEWASQLRHCVSQAFDIFNTFGRQPEALENILQGFAVSLNGYSQQEIANGFMEWMKTSSTMPTPYDIIEKIKLLDTGNDEFFWKEVPKTEGGLHVYSFGGKSWIKVKRERN